MLKRGNVLGPSHTAESGAYMLEKFTPPGICPVKEVELYKKF
jgi:hypothetical protein